MQSSSHRRVILLCQVFAVLLVVGLLVWNLSFVTSLTLRSFDGGKKLAFWESGHSGATFFPLPVKGPDMTNENNVHRRLNEKIKDISDAYTQAVHPRRFSKWGVLHFGGGLQQFKSALLRRNWTYVPESILMNLVSRNRPFPNEAKMIQSPEPNATYNYAEEEVENATTTAPPRVFNLDIVLAPCRLPNNDLYMLKRIRKIGTLAGEPSERKVVLKGNFYLATRQWFTSARPGCDYRTFHPETHYITNKQDCLHFNKSLVVPGEMWFLKQNSPLSFGMGITLVNHQTIEKNMDCNKLSYSSVLLMQRGVTNIIRYGGSVTQGRAYLLISGYQPTRAWFFMGYFNVAAGRSHVTNSGTNQKSDRLTFADLTAEMPQEHVAKLKHNIKAATQELFHVMMEEITEDKHSFSLFGFDYIIREDLSVLVLEANCNCELFANPQRFGEVRVNSSTNLVDSLVDIVIASNLSPERFDLALGEFIASDNDKLGDLQESNDLDSRGVRSYWELLYSEFPAYSYANLGACTATEL